MIEADSESASRINAPNVKICSGCKRSLSPVKETPLLPPIISPNEDADPVVKRKVIILHTILYRYENALRVNILKCPR